MPSRSVHRLLTFAADGESGEARTETQEKDPVQESETDSEIEVVFLCALLSWIRRIFFKLVDLYLCCMDEIYYFRLLHLLPEV